MIFIKNPVPRWSKIGESEGSKDLRLREHVSQVYVGENLRRRETNKFISHCCRVTFSLTLKSIFAQWIVRDVRWIKGSHAITFIHIFNIICEHSMAIWWIDTCARHVLFTRYSRSSIVPDVDDQAYIFAKFSHSCDRAY